MSCDCGCTNTTVDCKCPDPTGIAAAKLENIVSTTFSGGQDISGAGFTYTLYTNTSTSNQIVYVQTNMNITCTGTHNISSGYGLNAAVITATQFDDNATTKTDYTHFAQVLTLVPGDIVKIKIISSDATGKLQWLQSFIYKYDY